MKLSLVSIDKDGVIRVAADGSITAGDFPTDGKNPLETLLGLTWSTTRVLLDLSNISYIDSSAIGWLIGTVRSFREGGGKFVLHGVQPNVKQIFEVLRVGRVVPIAEDEAGARKVAMGEAQS
jgi:anti-anti-sigma factor